MVPDSWKPHADALSGLNLPDSFFPRLDLYLTALGRANQSLNLISFSDVNDLRAHAVDALQALRGAPAGSEQKVVDVGTGGGFPGIPLALARPQWRFFLLDSVRKKQAAVDSIAQAEGMDNVTVVWARAEEFARQPEQRESFDLALCRAVGRLSTVMELTLPMLKIGGAALLHRGWEGPREAAECEPLAIKMASRMGAKIPYRLFGLDRDRFVICIEKTSQIDTSFPRRPGIPAKRPLQ